ncbi:hypothetical protein V5O48_000684 [Marasmius crinis-equi]|uniref:Uncharacterized protein n=1 Tax=Marasmius crinis-equi TaxID=585013 RepID=A0ABR3G146_9AGAR
MSASPVRTAKMGVYIAWGTVTIYLNELSPPAFRALYPGTVYQLGNAASAAAAQIEATAGLSIRTTVDGEDQPDYGIVQAIMAAASCAVILACILVGPEKHSVEFDDGPPGGSADVTGTEKEQSAWTPVEKADDSSGPSPDSTVA